MKKINIYNVEVMVGEPVVRYNDTELMGLAKAKQYKMGDFSPEKTMEVEDDIAAKRVSLVFVQNVDSHHASVTWAEYANEEDDA